MKLVMIYPNPSQHSPSNFTPLSILFAGAFFEDKGYDVDYFDLRFDDEKKLWSSIKNADKLGISSMSGSHLGETIRILKKAKKINPNIHTILGGPHVKMLPEQCLKEAFVDEVITDDIGLEFFPFNKKTERFFKKPYSPIWFTSTGCPHNCSFCKIDNHWKPRPICRVINELSIIHEKIKFKRIDLCDANISKKIDRLSELGKFMRENGIDFHTNIRNDYLTKEVVRVLDKGNCKSLELGCESGNERILTKIVRKGHGVQAIVDAINNLKNTNISPMCSFMVGVPTETKKEIIESMNLVDWIKKKNDKARCSFYSYVPYPETYMLQLAKKEGYQEPKNMIEWANIKSMSWHPLYWIAGLCFRKKNTKENFPGKKRKIIAPYERQAEKAWQQKKWKDFPKKEVEELINNVQKI